MAEPTLPMPGQVERASAWLYSGIWAALTRLFLVPRDPPHMPSGSHEIIGAFRPSPGYLRYAKLFFWIGLIWMNLFLLVGWLVVTVAVPILGAVLAIPALIVIIAPNLFAYIAIHLRYDTTWYVLTDRSMRLRRGVMLLNETTITYENVQNVTVEQGPVQRFFGIADVIVSTAGGGGGGGGGGGSHGKRGGMEGGHVGRIEGVDNANHIRDLIMTRARASRSAGLGDEHHASATAAHAHDLAPGPAWTPAHLAALRQIRDLLPGGS
jgi:membrane protein YdbS with pleckstrin-like domain